MRALVVFVVIVLALVQSKPQQGGSLTDLIDSVFSGGGQNPSPDPNPSSGQTLPLTPNTNTIPDAEPRITGCEPGLECVPHYLCQESKIIKDGAGLIDIRFDGDDAPPQKCPNYLEVCCHTGDKTEIPIKPVYPTAHPQGCGYRNVDGIGFKITGSKDNETEYGEFPWMVAILKEERAADKILNIYQCGGSLIHPSVVLTAAHCVQNKPADTLKIRAGEWDTQTKNELFPHQDRAVAQVVYHEHYNKGSLYNDIALLFLQSPVELAENVQTVCIPPSNSNFDYERCIATGWGKDRFGQEGKYQVILKKIDLPVVPRDKCQDALRTTRLSQHFELHRSFTCAGGEIGKDTCKGDGGSPLVCPIQGRPGQYYQTGIVAWGIGCGDAIPGVYASVPVLRGWLDEQLAYMKIDSSYYTV